MKMVKIEKKIAGTLLAFALLAGVGISLSTTANAQYNGQNRRGRSNDNYPNWGGSFDLRQTALNAGYNEGMKEGEKDRSRNRRSNYDNFSAYQKADKDYNSRYGDRELYSRYYREAFKNGYDTGFGVNNNSNNGGWNGNNGNNNDGWNGNNNGNNGNNGRTRDQRWGRDWNKYGTYGGSFQLRQTALNAGYNEGIKKGREDRKKNRSYDVRRFDEYNDADHDYSTRLGDKGLYQRYYREGFENGYDAGYEGY